MTDRIAGAYAPRMAFDDLAKHMAQRDGKRTGTVGSASDVIAAAHEANRRADRTRDLILGPLLLVGGAVIAVLAFSIERTGEGTREIIMLSAFALGLVGVGARQTYRGIRNVPPTAGDGVEGTLDRLTNRR